MSIQQISSQGVVTSPVSYVGNTPRSQESAPSATAEGLSAKLQPNAAQLRQAMQAVGKAVAPLAQELRFSIDHDTGHSIVKLVDSATKEVIRQIPSEEMIQIARTLDKLQGLLLHNEA